MASKSAVLLVTDVPTLPATVVMWAIKTFEDKAAGGAGLTVLTNILQAGGKLGVETSSVDVLISLVETPGHHTSAWLLEVSRVLKPGGDFWIQEPIVTRPAAREEQSSLDAAPTQTKAALERSLLLAGFVGAQVVDSVDGVGLADAYKGITPSYLARTNGPLLRPIAVKAKKPTWDSRSVFAIKKKIAGQNGCLKSEATVQTDCGQQTEATMQTDVNGSKDVTTGGDTPLPTSRTVKLASSDLAEEFLPGSKPTFKLTDLSDNFEEEAAAGEEEVAGEEEDELVDEDELLTEEDLTTPELPEADNCGVSKKACKNCSCGRRELEEKQQQTELTASQISNPVSACGSCGLGDAFRCAGCPYRGLPTFKLGEKITLGGALLVADA